MWHGCRGSLLEVETKNEESLNSQNPICVMSNLTRTKRNSECSNNAYLGHWGALMSFIVFIIAF